MTYNQSYSGDTPEENQEAHEVMQAALEATAKMLHEQMWEDADMSLLVEALSESDNLLELHELAKECWQYCFLGDCAVSLESNNMRQIMRLMRLGSLVTRIIDDHYKQWAGTQAGWEYE